MISAADNRLTFSREGESLVLEPYGPDVIRVRSTAGGRVLDEAWTLLPPAPDCAVVTREVGKAVLCNGKIFAEMTDDGHICYFNDRGGELLREQWAYERDLPGRWMRKSVGDLFKVETLFVPQAGEHFYGMGQESHDLFDLKGSVIELCQQNTKSTIPFVISSRGYGFLWNNPGIGRVEFGASRTRWVAEAARQMDYLVVAGGDIPEIVRRYSSLTGYAPEFPRLGAGALAVQAPLRDAGAAARGRAGVQAARHPAVDDRLRLLPLAAARRLEVRSPVLAGPCRHGPRAERNGRKAPRFHLADGRPPAARTTRRCASGTC